MIDHVPFDAWCAEKLAEVRRIAPPAKVVLSDGRFVHERRARGYVTQALIDKHGSYAKALAALNAQNSPKPAIPAGGEEGDVNAPASSSTITELRTVRAISPTRPGDPDPSPDGAENHELRVAPVPSTFKLGGPGDSAGVARR